MVALALLGARLGGAVGSVLVPAAGLAHRPAHAAWSARRAARHYDDELVHLLRAVARGLRSGAVLRVALAEASVGVAGPLADDLVRLAHELDGGVVPALRSWAHRRPAPSVTLVAGGMALGYASGGIDAPVVDALADAIRLRLEGRDEAAALATQATLSALVLAGAPLAFLVVGAIGVSGSGAFLAHQSLGRACLAAGLALDAAALAWMLRIIRSVDR